MGIRFQQHHQSIEMLRKLADRLGITELIEFNDVVPLMFSHTAFKSYPPMLIDKKRFDLMTKWLDKLTSYDLSDVDAQGCKSIDDWIDLLDEQTPLQVITSSGTTGTISILPKDKHGAVDGMELWKICLFQTFGQEPTDEELNPNVDVIWPNFASGKLGHLRIAQMIKQGFTGGDESKFHPLYPGSVETDLMFLASKMRAAASRGELDRLEIDPALAARKDEFIAMQLRQPQELDAFFTKLAETLQGQTGFHDQRLPPDVRDRQGRPGTRRHERLRQRLGHPHRRWHEGRCAATGFHATSSPNSSASTRFRRATAFPSPAPSTGHVRRAAIT